MKQIQGDLLEIKSGLVLHQVNVRAVTGGLAGALRRKYPAAFKVYLDACESLNNSVEEGVQPCVIGKATPTLSIAHLFGQIHPGPNTNMKMVEDALSHLANWKGIKDYRAIYAPYKLGCGLGGGDWPSYLSLLIKYIPDVIVVQKYD